MIRAKINDDRRWTYIIMTVKLSLSGLRCFAILQYQQIPAKAFPFRSGAERPKQPNFTNKKTDRPAYTHRQQLQTCLVDGKSRCVRGKDAMIRSGLQKQTQCNSRSDIRRYHSTKHSYRGETNSSNGGEMNLATPNGVSYSEVLQYKTRLLRPWIFGTSLLPPSKVTIQSHKDTTENIKIKSHPHSLPNNQDGWHQSRSNACMVEHKSKKSRNTDRFSLLDNTMFQSKVFKHSLNDHVGLVKVLRGTRIMWQKYSDPS